MHRARRRRTSLIALALALAAAGDARAQRRHRHRDPRCPELDGEIALGNEERRAGRFSDARARFAALLVRCPIARVRAQLALTETDLRMWRPAWEHLREALAAETDPWIRARRAVLLSELRAIRDRLARFDLRATVPGARLIIDGSDVGALPLAEPWVVEPGDVVVEVTAEGYRTLRRTYAMHEGQLVDELLRLEREGSPIPETEPPARTPARAPTPDLSPVALLPPPAAAPPGVGTAQRAVGWSVIAIGGVFAGLAVWRLAEGLALRDAAAIANPYSNEPYRSWFFYENLVNADRALSPGEVCDRAAGDTTLRAAVEARNHCARVDTETVLFWTFAATSAALVGTGAVLVATARRAAPSLALTPSLGPSGAALTLRGTF